MNDNKFFSRDVLYTIGLQLDYKSFINLLRTCKKYYEYAPFLVPLIYKYIDYTNLNSVLAIIKNAINSYRAGNNSHLKSFYRIEKTINYKSDDPKNKFIYKNDIYSSKYILPQQYPKYQLASIRDIIDLLYLYIVDPNNMLLLNKSFIHYNNVVFIFGDGNKIIHVRSIDNNHDIVIDITKIVDMNNHCSDRNNHIFKYLLCGAALVGCYMMRSYLKKSDKQK